MKANKGAPPWDRCLANRGTEDNLQVWDMLDEIYVWWEKQDKSKSRGFGGYVAAGYFNYDMSKIHVIQKAWKPACYWFRDQVKQGLDPDPRNNNRWLVFKEIRNSNRYWENSNAKDKDKL